jgi:hypothetical protein
MKTDNMIDLPKDLFSSIDIIHSRATTIYNGISSDAMELISSQRDKKKLEEMKVSKKSNEVKEDIITTSGRKLRK